MQSERPCGSRSRILRKMSISMNAASRYLGTAGGLIGARMARSAHNKTTMQQKQRRTASGQACAGATTDRGRDV
jgi:hypothetical protein